MLTHNERISSARKVIEGLLRARRSVRIYPGNSVVTIKALNELYANILKLLSSQDRIAFDITEDVILFELEEVFHAASRQNNIALLLFRDGVREVVFKKGLTRDEVSDFVHVISADLERTGTGDDVVTRMWDYDFKNIRFIACASSSFAAEGSSKSAAEGRPSESDFSSELLRAHREASLKKEEDTIPDIMEFSDEDLIALRKEIAGTNTDKTGKLLAIVLELFILAETQEEYGEIEDIMKKAFGHALAKGKIDVLADFFMKVKTAYMDASSRPLFKENLSRIFSSFSSEDFLTKMGYLLDSGLRLEAETFGKLVLLLDKRSIPVLIKLLGYLDTISARKTVVNILSKVGESDVSEVTAGLDDWRWYVVRNIVIVLREIGDKTAKRHLVKIIDHGDARVRREAVKALASISGEEALGILSKALDDRDQSVRRAALVAISEFGIPQAKTLLLDRVKSRNFLALDYQEKKEYIRALLEYNGEDVRLLIREMLGREPLFGKAKNDENRIAIANSIGSTGDREFLPYLYKLGDSKSEMLQLAAAEAIRKIEHGS